MAVRHILNEYLEQAMKHVHLEQQENGSVAAYIPQFPGTLAYGHNRVEALTQLVDRLDGWVRNAIAQSYDLPVLGDIDFNDPSNRELAMHDQRIASASLASHILENDAELDAEFQTFGP